VLELRAAPFEDQAGRRAKALAGTLQPLPVSLDDEARCAAESLARPLEPLTVALDGPARSAGQAGAGAVEPLHQFVRVRNHEPRRDARGRGADVCGQVAERGVLLVADCRDDRHGA
jgi:hypothetical protein